MHLFLTDCDNDSFLLEELRRVWPDAKHATVAPGLVQSEAPIDFTSPTSIVFARQFLPNVRAVSAPSIGGWSDRILEEIEANVSSETPWILQVIPHYEISRDSAAGTNRCKLIEETVQQKLKRQNRRRLRMWRKDPEPFSPTHSFVQLLLTSPEQGWFSIAPAPAPYRLRGVFSPFPKGEIPVAVDKSAPSRAFAKLIEAEIRLGRRIRAGERCVDLGASPGSWTYVAVERGAHVIAVDRSPLRDDLMSNSLVSFQQGDAFRFVPKSPVDWLLCDVIAAPERSIELVLQWMRERLATHFIVTIKFKGSADYPLLEALKSELARSPGTFFLSRLCANKNEACVFGSFAEEGGTV